MVHSVGEFCPGWKESLSLNSGPTVTSTRERDGFVFSEGPTPDAKCLTAKALLPNNAASSRALVLLHIFVFAGGEGGARGLGEKIFY